MRFPQATLPVLSLDDVDVAALIDDLSITTGYKFILHQDVLRTKASVMSQAPMDTEDVFQALLATLRGRTRGLAECLKTDGDWRCGRAVSGTSSNAFITQVFKLDNFSTVEAAQIVRLLVHAQGQVLADANSNNARPDRS